MCKRFVFLAFVILLLGLSNPAKATDYYVSPSGSDSNTGTSPEQAWKGIDRVNEAAFKAGDSIFFEGGRTFSGSVRFDANDSGTEANPVTVGSYGTDRATINSGSEHGLHAKDCGGFIVKDLIFAGSGKENAKGKSGIYFFTGINGNKPEYIRIDNVQVRGYRREGIYIAGGGSNSGFKDVRISRAEVFDNGDKGISVWGPQPKGDWVHKDIYIGHCKVYNNIGIAGAKGHTGNGIIVSSIDGGIIEFCESYNNGELCSDPHSGGPVGIWAWDSHNVVIQFCESYNNKTGNEKDGGGFDLDGGCVDCVMQYNYSHGNYGAGYGIYQYGGAREFKNNIVRYNISENDGLVGKHGGINLWSTSSAGGIQNTKIYNNTVYLSSNAKGAAIVDFTDTEGETYVYNTQIYNNIFVSAAGKKVVDVPNPAGGWSFKGNCYWSSGAPLEIVWGGSTYTSLAAWRSATGQEKIDGKDVGFEVDPQLVKAGSGGTIGDIRKLAGLKAYQLMESSPLIDAGLDIKGLFGIDAGKYDYYGTEIPSGAKFDVGAHEFFKGDSGKPVGWWKFDEGAGTVAKNCISLAGRCNGTLNDMDDESWVKGCIGEGALSFDGGDDVIVPALDLNSNSVTISAWVKRDGQQSAYTGIVYSRDGDTIAGIGLGSTGGPDWQANQELYYSWNDAEDTWKFHSGLIIPDSKWVFVALVLEPAKATLYLGEDAKLSPATNIVEHSMEEFNGVTRIGNDKKAGFGPRFFKGVIDDVRIYDRALSPEQIRELTNLVN
jgi:hypothetical protein